jgi:hypothetical protein
MSSSVVSILFLYRISLSAVGFEISTAVNIQVDVFCFMTLVLYLERRILLPVTRLLPMTCFKALF